SMVAIQKIPFDSRIDTQNEILNKTLEQNEHFMALWVSWELSYLEPSLMQHFGRQRYMYKKNGGTISFSNDALDLSGEETNSTYYRVKLTKTEEVTPPFRLTGNVQDSILVTTIMVPIFVNERLVGVTGIDVDMSRYDGILSRVRPVAMSEVSLLANNGSFIANSMNSWHGKNIALAYPSFAEQANAIEKIKSGKEFSGYYSEQNIEYFYNVTPIRFGNQRTPWSLLIRVPSSSLSSKAKESLYFALFVGLIGLSLLAIVITIIATYISKPLKQMSHKLKQIEQGVFHVGDKLAVKSKDELGLVAISVNTLIDTLNSTAEFATRIGKGELDAKYQLLSPQDRLGKALLEMQSNLQHAKTEEETRKENEVQQNWIQRGIADSGVILRQNAESIEDFGFDIVRFLVKYTDMNQGAFFYINDFDPADPHITMGAAYAYDKRRIKHRRIEMQEGIVARTIHERETIYMTNVPESYFKITSGVGERLPKSIILLPLIFENEVFGVIELASFEEIESYKIYFLEQLAERTAAFLASLKRNLKNKILLDKSRNEIDELRKQEHKMSRLYREASLELHDTKLALWDANLMANSVQNILGIAWYNFDGALTKANDTYREMFSVTEVLEYKHVTLDGIRPEEIENQPFWDKLRKGIKQKRHGFVKVKEYTLFYEETLSPVFDEKGIVISFISVCIDITEYVSNQAKNNR
ncbi:MAG: Chemotaxis regulator BdlA, partial [Bacteroidota bacterium]